MNSVAQAHIFCQASKYLPARIISFRQEMRVSRETEEYSKRNLSLGGGSPIKMFIPCSYPTAIQFLVPHSWTEEVKEHSTLGEIEWQRLKWTAKRGLWGKRNNVKIQRKGSKRNIFRKIKEVTVHMKQKPEFLQIWTILKNKNFLKIQLNGQKVKLKKFH